MDPITRESIASQSKGVPSMEDSFLLRVYYRQTLISYQAFGDQDDSTGINVNNIIEH